MEAKGAPWGLYCKSREGCGPLGSLLGAKAPRWRARRYPRASTASPVKGLDPLGSLLGSEAPGWRPRGYPGASIASPGRVVDPWVACWGQRPLGGGPGCTLGPLLQVQGELWTPG